MRPLLALTGGVKQGGGRAGSVPGDRTVWRPMKNSQDLVSRAGRGCLEEFRW